METLKIIQNDPWLSPYKNAIEGRHQRAIDVKYDLTNGNKIRFTDFADGYLYFGLHRQPSGRWIFREWAPNATAIYLIGDFPIGKSCPNINWKKQKTEYGK